MTAPTSFTPLPVDSNGIVTWIHLGDLHMVKPGEQNHRDLQAIVDEINATFAGRGVNFVYLPGDIADDGSTTAYRAVRECLDRLRVPLCAVVGAHDVHEKSFDHFKQFMSEPLYGAFSVGNMRFFRLNTFSEPRPDSFIVDDEQLDWLEKELKAGTGLPVILMHCYPSDLKQGGPRLSSLIREHGVRVVDMGHTHYNEISNDGKTLYCATRSTGQIEEGPVGYSVLSLHGDSFSWQFNRLGAPALVSIVSPCDARLLTKPGAAPLHPGAEARVDVRVWSPQPIASVTLEAFGSSLPMEEANDLWTATIPASKAIEGLHELYVKAVLADGSTAEDRIRIAVGDAPQSRHAEVDQENALGEWLDRDLLGTQLGPNKNGRKW